MIIIKKRLTSSVFLIILFLFVVQLFSARNAASERLYKWTDKRGATHITDYPPPDTEKREGPVEVIEEEPGLKLDRTIVYTVGPFLSAKAKRLQGRLREGLRDFFDIPSRGTASILLFIGIPVALHLYYALCLYLFSRKLGVSSAWLAWVPALNVFPLVSAAKKPWWWGVLFLMPLSGLIPLLYFNIYMVAALFVVCILDFVLWGIVWMRVCANLWINKWLGLLVFVPLAQLVLIGYLAFKREPQEETYGGYAGP